MTRIQRGLHNDVIKFLSVCSTLMVISQLFQKVHSKTHLTFTKYTKNDFIIGSSRVIICFMFVINHCLITQRSAAQHVHMTCHVHIFASASVSYFSCFKSSATNICTRRLHVIDYTTIKKNKDTERKEFTRMAIFGFSAKEK